MSNVILKVPDLSGAAKSALQAQQQQPVSQQFQQQQQQVPIQSPYGAPQYPLKAIGDPQPATTNVKWGGYTEEVRFYPLLFSIFVHLSSSFLRSPFTCACGGVSTCTLSSSGRPFCARLDWSLWDPCCSPLLSPLSPACLRHPLSPSTRSPLDWPRF